MRYTAIFNDDLIISHTNAKILHDILIQKGYLPYAERELKNIINIPYSAHAIKSKKGFSFYGLGGYLVIVETHEFLSLN